MKSMDFATSSVSISARTSLVYGLTVRNGPPATASTICGPFAISTSAGTFIECVIAIVST